MVGPEQVAEALAAHPWQEHPALPGRTNHLRAGVAVPLWWTEGGLRCLLTLRPTSLRRHGGEVSLPGGRPDEQDRDLADTACRECREEIGLQPSRVLGRLSSLPVYTSDWRLEPFVVEVDASRGLVLQPDEVEELVQIDLVEVLHRGVIEAVGVPWQDTLVDLPIFRPGGHVTYGATSLAVTELLGVLAPRMGLAVPRLERGPLRWQELRDHKARAGRS